MDCILSLIDNDQLRITIIFTELKVEILTGSDQNDFKIRWNFPQSLSEVRIGRCNKVDQPLKCDNNAGGNEGVVF